MKITTLIENTTSDKELSREHGLSLLIETKNKKILFDSGQSGKFIDNAEKLGIDLDNIDFVVLSHGHYDHGGGLKRFLKVNNKVKIFVNQNAFGDYYHGKAKYIGLDKNLLKSDRLVFTNDDVDLGNGIRLYSCNGKELKFPIDSSNLFKFEDSNYIPDNFEHEHYLEIEEDGKKILFSGCSHKGILNIMNWFKPDVLIGGFHFMEIALDDEGKDRLKEAAKELNNYNTVYFTGHCTGKKQYKFLKEKMGDKLNYISTGSSFFI